MFEDLVNKYKPILYLHSKEEAYPSSIEFIMENSTINKKTGEILEQVVSNDIIYDKYKDNSGSDTEIVLKNEDLRYGERDLSKDPIYSYVLEKDSEIHIFYVFLYPYNSSKNIAGIRKVGAHFGDLEHMTVVLDKTTKNIKEIFYSAHGNEEGRWVKKEDAPFEGDRPIGYIAMGSHATYPKTGVVFRYYGFANDLVEKGIKWDPQVIQVYNNANDKFDKSKMGWIYYGGRIGKDGIGSLSGRDFIQVGDGKDNKPFSIISNTNMKIREILFFMVIILLFYLYISFSFKQKKVSPFILIGILMTVIVIFFIIANKELAKL